MKTTSRTFSNLRGTARDLLAWVASGWVSMAVALGASPSAAKQHYEAGRFAEAQSEYQKLLREKPEDSRLSYNAATSAYKHGDLTNATLGFENALATQDLKLQQKAYYNLGNTRFRMGDMAQSPEEKMSHWEESVKDFGSALKLQPDDADAKHNQALVQEMLEELKKQMPKQKQKNPNQNKDDKKDDDKDQDKDKDQNQDSKESKDKQDSKDQKEDGDSEKKDSEQKDQDSQQGKDSKEGAEQKDQDPQSKSGEGKDEKDKDKEGKPSDAASKSDAQAKKEAEEERQAAAMGKMTPQMAEKLLDAQKGNEKAMLFRVQQQRPKGKDRVFKNW